MTTIRRFFHDPKTYPDPERFDPERWLAHEKDFPEVAFGHGRRQCPARYFVREWMFITFASILATFDISKAVDANGREIEPVDDFSATLFRCVRMSQSHLLSVLMPL